MTTAELRSWVPTAEATRAEVVAEIATLGELDPYATSNARTSWRQRRRDLEADLAAIDYGVGSADAVSVELMRRLEARGVKPMPGERSVLAGRPGLRKALRLIAQREEEARRLGLRLT